MILAVCGKGGVGKTTVAAVAAKLLSVKDEIKALVVDADPAGGLGMALGVQARKNLNDVRKELIEEVKAGRREPRDLAVSVDYLLAEALTERGNLALLSIGRPEDAGCYCKVNVILKDAIKGLAVRFDETVVDAEAGIEQVNRKVLGSVDYVLLVADTSMKAVRTAETISAVGATMAPGAGFGLLVNRVVDEGQVAQVRAATDLEVIGWVPEDPTVRRFDEEELSFLDLPDCPASAAIGAALVAIL